MAKRGKTRRKTKGKTRKHRRAGVATRSGKQPMQTSPKKRNALTSTQKREKMLNTIMKQMQGINIGTHHKPHKKKITTKKARNQMRRSNIFKNHRKKVKSISPSDLFRGLTI
jgi:hypothetical protein